MEEGLGLISYNVCYNVCNNVTMFVWVLQELMPWHDWIHGIYCGNTVRDMHKAMCRVWEPEGKEQDPRIMPGLGLVIKLLYKL